MPDNYDPIDEAVAFATVPRRPTPKPTAPPATHYWMDELPRPDHEGNKFMSICCLCKKTFRARYAGACEQKVLSHLHGSVHKIAFPRRTWRRPAPKRQRNRAS